MKYEKFQHSERPMSVEAASDYARRLVEAEARGPGDLDNALDRIEQRYGIGRWTIAHLRSGRAKTCDTSIFARLRGAYLDLCQRQLSKLQHQIAMEKAAGDDTMEDLEAEAASLAEKIAARKAMK